MFTIDQSTHKEDPVQTAAKAKEAIQKRLESSADLDQANVLKWLDTVFETSIRLSKGESFEPSPPEPLTLPKEISAFAIQTIIRILTAVGEPQDEELYYLNDTGAALGIQPEEMRNLLDNEFEKLRLEFTKQLKQKANEKQLHWCALILLKIICVDGKIHPAEKKFFTIINELIKDSSFTLEMLKDKLNNITELPNLKMDDESARMMLKYVVTIAMCDGEYVGQESEFIKQTAESLGIEATQIDSILQPVASSFMVLESLFPRLDK